MWQQTFSSEFDGKVTTWLACKDANNDNDTEVMYMGIKKKNVHVHAVLKHIYQANQPIWNLSK